MKYFTIQEFERSDAAILNHIDNTAPTEVRRCLECLVYVILDPLRKEMEHSIIVNSGYRCPELNRIVHGAENSQHIHGQAADITLRDEGLNRKAFNRILQGDFDQCIIYDLGRFIHVSYNPYAVRQRRMAMQIHNGVVIQRKNMWKEPVFEIKTTF